MNEKKYINKTKILYIVVLFSLVLAIASISLEKLIFPNEIHSFSNTIIIFSLSIFFSIILIRVFSRTILNLDEIKRLNDTLNYASKIANIGFWEYDVKSKKITWTDTIYDIFDIENTKEQIDYDKFLSFLPENEKETLTKTFDESIKNKKEYNFIHSIITNKNNTKFVEEKGKHIYDEQGNHIKSIGSIHNITSKYLVEKDILNQKDELKTIFDTYIDGIIIINFSSNFLFFNEAFSNMLGYKQSELLEKNFLDIIPAQNIESFKKYLLKAKQRGYVKYIEEKLISQCNKTIDTTISIALMPDKQRFLLSIKNIPNIKKDELLINEYVKIVDDNVITSSTDLSGTITYASEAFCKVSGFSKEELIGKQHNIIRHPDMDNEIFKDMWDNIKEGKTWKGEIKNKKKDGGFYWVSISISPIYDESHKKVGYTAIRQDITDRKIIEEIAVTDPLTKIYNRRYYDTNISKILNSAKRRNELISYLMIDIDYFKSYNDTYGHQLGDKALKKVATTINNSLHRADDYCFRFGGEEFVVIYKTETKEQALSLASTLKNNIEKLKIEHKNSNTGYISISIGMVCKYSNEIVDINEIYKEADALLYRAKEQGRNALVST